MGVFWRVGVVDFVVLACVLRAITKKVVNFLSCLPKYFLLESPRIKISTIAKP